MAHGHPKLQNGPHHCISKSVSPDAKYGGKHLLPSTWELKLEDCSDPGIGNLPESIVGHAPPHAFLVLHINDTALPQLTTPATWEPPFKLVSPFILTILTK